MLSALLCAPDPMEGTRTWFVSWLARAGACEPLCCFHSSLLSWYWAGGLPAGGEADELLHSGMYFVMFPLIRPCTSTRNIIPSLPFASLTTQCLLPDRDQPVCLATCGTEQCSA